MDNSTLLVPKVEPNSDLDCDHDLENSPGMVQGDQNIEIVSKFKDELTSEELEEYQECQGLFEEIDEGSYIVSKIEVVDELVSPGHFPITVDDPEDPDWDCPICRKQISVYKKLKEHLASHFTSDELQNKPQCPICGQEFNRLAKVYSHIVAAHKNDRKGVEDDQNEGTEEQDNSDWNESDVNASVIKSNDKHSSEREEGSENPIDHEKLNGNQQKVKNLSKFKCETCGRGFTKKHKLMEHHRRFHTNEKPFKCSTCELSFVTKWELKRHLLVHNEVRPFPCETCGSRFKTKGNLRAHAAIHEKNSVLRRCNTCGREVLNLNEHQQDCMKKLFACSECPKSYDSNGQLTNHFRAYHVKEKNHSQCPLCTKMFGTPWAMKRHLKCAHTKDKSFACSLCEKKFKSRSSLDYHKKTKHENKDI